MKALGFNTITYRPLKFRMLDELGGGHLVMPIDGLVFYAPLNGNNVTAATGQILTTSGTVSYDIVNNVPCAYFNNSNINSAVSGLPTGGSARTISLWLKASNVRKSYMLSYGSEAGSRYCTLVISDSGYLLGFVAWGNDHQINTNYDLTKWTHYLATYENGVLKLYVNGNQEKQIQISLNTGSSNVYLGSRISNTEYFNGYIAAARIYDRVLTQDEITLLSREFSPTE